jgi:hypothetical protein
MKKRRFRRRCNGISLLEVLMVAVIVAVLAGFVLAVVLGSKGYARRITCTSNLKQVGAAFALYRADWDDRFPPDRIIVEPLPPKRLVWQLLQPYAHGGVVFYCPEDAKVGLEDAGYTYRASHASPVDSHMSKLGVESASTTAVCMMHLKNAVVRAPGGGTDIELIRDVDGWYSGRFIYLRNDGSVATCDAKAVQEWVSDGREWHRRGQEPAGFEDRIRSWRYPGEPWPPTFD